MRSVTIKEAKAHLNELIEAAERGEQVVLMRGSRHVATIVPIGDEDIELSPRLTDAQAAKVWSGRSACSSHRDVRGLISRRVPS